jgi:hypothetical protein
MFSLVLRAAAGGEAVQIDGRMMDLPLTLCAGRNLARAAVSRDAQS